MKKFRLRTQEIILIEVGQRKLEMKIMISVIFDVANQALRTSCIERLVKLLTDPIRNCGGVKDRKILSISS